MFAEFWGVPGWSGARSGSARANAAPLTASAAPRLPSPSRMDERARVLEIARPDRLRRPECKRRQSSRRIVARVLRKSARAHDEEVRHIPTLQVAIDGARLRIRPHDRTAAQMGRLIISDVVWSLAIFLHDLPRAHGLKDLRKLIGEEGVLLQLIVVKIHGNPHQRALETILVGRIKIEIHISVAVHAAVHARSRLECALVTLAHGLLPLGAPFGRARRRRCRLNRAAVGLPLPHVAAADEPVWTVVEVIAVELIDAHPDGARGDERIEGELRRIEEAR